MAVAADELIEFYRQLALLVNSSLPLPEGLAGLARSCGDRRFARVLDTVAADAGAGRPLGEALARHPGVFSPFHAALVRSGERAGILPQALAEVVRLAQFNRDLVLRVREIAFYPLLVIVLAVGVCLLLLRFVLGDMGRMMAELVGSAGGGLPAFSRLLFAGADGVARFWWPLAVLYVAAIVGLAWLFGPHPAARHALWQMVARLPGMGRVLWFADLARCCGLWAVFVRHQAPFPDALEVTAALVETPALRAALATAVERCRTGQDPGDALAGSGALPENVLFAFRHTPEAELAKTLDDLRDDYLENLRVAARRTAVFWETGGFLFMAMVVGGMILSLFAPLWQCLARMSSLE